MLEVAGFIATGVGLASQLSSQFSNWRKWEERDLEVDREWLDLAIKEGVIADPKEDFLWCAPSKVQTRVQFGDYDQVVVYNENDRTKCRVVRMVRDKVDSVLLRRCPGNP